MFYSAPGKTENDIIASFGRCNLIADSLNEVRLIRRIAESRKEHICVGLRIAPDFICGRDNGISSKFGISAKDLPRAAADTKKLGKLLTDIAADNLSRHKARLIIESGRHIVCSAGRYYMPVTDIKSSNGRRYIIIRGGLNGFMRPVTVSLFGDRSSADPIYTNPNSCGISVMGKAGGRYEKVTVVGDLSTENDVIAENIMLPHVEIGDIIVLTNAGSYGFTLSPVDFSGFLPPAQLVERSG